MRSLLEDRNRDALGNEVDRGPTMLQSGDHEGAVVVQEVDHYAALIRCPDSFW